MSKNQDTPFSKTRFSTEHRNRSFAADQYFGHIHDPAASPDAIPLFISLTVIGLIVSIFYLYFLHEKSNSKEGLA